MVQLSYKTKTIIIFYKCLNHFLHCSVCQRIFWKLKICITFRAQLETFPSQCNYAPLFILVQILVQMIAWKVSSQHDIKTRTLKCAVLSAAMQYPKQQCNSVDCSILSRSPKLMRSEENDRWEIRVLVWNNCH